VKTTTNRNGLTFFPMSPVTCSAGGEEKNYCCQENFMLYVYPSIYLTSLQCVAYICAVWPVYIVKVYVLKGGNKGGTGATPTSILIFDSYDMKTLYLNFVMISSLVSSTTNTFILALWNIRILLQKQAKLRKDIQHSVCMLPCSSI
jgi:hypothetical protein